MPIRVSGLPGIGLGFQIPHAGTLRVTLGFKLRLQCSGVRALYVGRAEGAEGLWLQGVGA